MDSLRALLTIFYDPPRGMALTRDRAPLAQAILLSLVVQAIYVVVIQALYQNGFSHLNPLYVTIGLSGVGRSWLFSMLGFVPALLMVGNLFEKRDNALGVIKQEYAPFASCILYAQIVATIIAIPLALLIHFT